MIMRPMKMDIHGCGGGYSKVQSSFSSTLLEAVYRSIDEEGELETVFETVDYSSSSSIRVDAKKKQSSSTSARSIRCWKREEMAKKPTAIPDKHPRTPPPEAKVMGRNRGKAGSSHHCCSDSSRAGKHERVETRNNGSIPNSKSTDSGRSGHSGKTKSHALGFYKELKKMKKKPVSPGARLAAFVSSLFLTAHSKKEKLTSDQTEDAGSAQPRVTSGNNINKSTCSSASSFSRTCLSHKNSSSSASPAPPTHKAPRSVRFSSPEERKPVETDESCDVQSDDIQAMLWKYQTEDLFAIYDKFASQEDQDEEDDDDEISSCGSSDLFELDVSIGPAGLEGLPVYETTRLDDANRPIANSLYV